MDYVANSGRLLKDKKAMAAFLVCTEGIAENDSDLKDLYINQGTAFLCMKKYKDAISSFDKALELAPDDESAKHNREIAVRSEEAQQPLTDDIIIKGI